MLTDDGRLCRGRTCNTLTFLALAAAGLAGNYFKFSLFLNIDFLFGSIFALLALQLLGLRLGTAAAAVIGTYTYVLWNHPYAIIILAAEAAVVGLLMERHKCSMISADVMYWIFIGAPLVYLFYHGVMKVPLGNVHIIVSKQAVNGVANAIVARLLFTGFALRSRFAMVPFREMISSLFAFFVLAPALLLLALEVRNEFAETDHLIRAGLKQDIEREAAQLATWLTNRKTVIQSLAVLAESKTPQQVQPHLEQATRSDPNVQRTGLLNRSETVTAYYPEHDNQGGENVGQTFLDDRYIARLRKTLKPIVSEAVQAEGDGGKMLVTLLVPVVVRGEYQGCVTGVLDLTQVRDRLDRSCKLNGMLYTLLDGNGAVIMSNRPDQTPMTPFRRGKGTVKILDNGITQLVPYAPPNTPMSERWKNSLYSAESRIGEPVEWKLLMEQPVAPFQKKLYDKSTNKLIVLSLVMLMSLALASFLARRIMATIENLRQVTNDLPAKLASGGSVEWPQSGITETNDLIQNFQVMSETIEEHLTELQRLNDCLEQRVSERTQQVERLASEQRTILATMPIGACLLMDRKIRMANPAFDRITGYEPGETLGMDAALFHPDSQSYEKFWSAGSSAAAEDGIHSTDLELRRKDGSLIWCNTVGQMVNPQAPGDGFIWMVQDISERKMMESQLRASETHYRLLTEDVADVVWKLDAGYRFTYISPADERLRGYRADEVLGHTVLEQTTDEWHEVVTDKMRPAGEESETLEIQQRCKNGQLIWTEIFFTPEYDASGAITGYHGITRDITQRKQAVELEQQLLHAQKLESLGVLAGGIAHDFNNILMAIIGNADLAQIRLGAGSPASENLQRIQDAASRAADLTSQMLAYSGKGRFVVERLDLNHLLDNMLHLLEVSVSKKAALKFNLQRPLPLILADATQIRQVVMNLVINASEAIGDSSGEITIATGISPCDSTKETRQRRNMGKRPCVYLVVADTGCGMDSETVERIFDPFFTTKFTGRGLGMAAVQGIVKGHHGSIEISSEPGVGTTFTVFFPVAEEQGQVPAEPGRETGDASWQGRGTVLMVEDEETVLDIGVQMLETLGFKTLTAKDGVEAVEVYKSAPDVALVILDLTMPRMDGRQCLRELRRLDPAVKVIMSSGFNEQELARELEGAPCGFIQKPYDLAKLQEAIRKYI
ncbi:Sensory box histidine kinase/response regulator [Citrifermentans bremense]|uniref:histidine kinase n=1 Tax=Citrifermentans bremense TaxID=60035 RepID=A0A6S6M2Y7_9BACT|nr:PAS domain S-box protein [Citrifermentans bremense]BCG45984.1 Sensory box histidine kinase/response regulator [Citrifermentans bremense]